MTEIEKRLDIFKESMLKEIHDNQHKGDILDWVDIDDMLVELEWHKAKLMVAMRKTKNLSEIKEYIADCADILFAIGNAYNLYNPRFKPSEISVLRKDFPDAVDRFNERDIIPLSNHIMRNPKYRL